MIHLVIFHTLSLAQNITFDLVVVAVCLLNTGLCVSDRNYRGDGEPEDGNGGS